MRAAVVNSGNANAATGEQGYRDALAMRDAAADALGIEPRAVAVAETGMIGVPLPSRRRRRGHRRGRRRLLRDGRRASSRDAIMTTDRWPKAARVRAGGVTLSAQAKGAGMIEPGFATMLCFVQTDAVVAEPEAALRAAVAGSFERITVDGQMSTNDTVLLQASGEPGSRCPTACSTRCCSSWRWRSSPTARARRGSAGSRSTEAPRRRTRPSAWRGRSPTRRW